MRKVSKSRVDDADDVVSSTNGSAVNDDQPDEDKQADDADYDADERNKNSDTDIEEKDDEPHNVSKSKSKGRGRPKSKKAKSKKSKAEKNADKPDNSKEEEEYEVEKIIDSKKIKGRVHYLIRWKGYSASSDSWEPENTLSCQELINKFNEEHQDEATTNKVKGSSKAAKGKKRKSGKKDSKSSASPSKRTKTEWDSENADENAEYEVERILEVHHKKNGKREFLIHWKGWSTKFDSWEPEDNLNCPELIKKFMEKVSAAKTTESRSLRVAPETTNRFTLQERASGRRLSKRHGQRQRVRYDDAE